MRRILVLCLLVAGCGSDVPDEPADQVAAWVRAVDARDWGRACELARDQGVAEDCERITEDEFGGAAAVELEPRNSANRWRFLVRPADGGQDQEGSLTTAGGTPPLRYEVGTLPP
jgi:hypothetical protein